MANTSKIKLYKNTNKTSTHFNSAQSKTRNRIDYIHFSILEFIKKYMKIRRRFSAVKILHVWKFAHASFVSTVNWPSPSRRLVVLVLERDRAIFSMKAFTNTHIHFRCVGFYFWILLLPLEHLQPVTQTEPRRQRGEVLC